jgi:hypothetical protein
MERGREREVLKLKKRNFSVLGKVRVGRIFLKSWAKFFEELKLRSKQYDQGLEPLGCKH